MSDIKTVTLTIFIILGMIILPTIYKVVKDHNDKLYLVSENEFYFQANRCFKSDICTDNKVTLKELYDNKYIEEELYNPVSKKYYSDESFVLIDKKEIHFKY